MCHMRACVSHITLLFWIVCYSVYKLENRSGRGEDEIEDKIDYRGLVNKIATVAPPHTHQTMPCYMFWREKSSKSSFNGKLPHH